jgi:hypothetical protein
MNSQVWDPIVIRRLDDAVFPIQLIVEMDVERDGMDLRAAVQHRGENHPPDQIPRTNQQLVQVFALVCRPTSAIHAMVVDVRSDKFKYPFLFERKYLTCDHLMRLLNVAKFDSYSMGTHRQMSTFLHSFLLRVPCACQTSWRD